MMKRKFSLIKVMLLFLIQDLISIRICAQTLDQFNIINNDNKSIIVLYFQDNPVYNFYFLHHPERLILDVFNISLANKKIFPIIFNDKNLIKCVHKNVLIKYNNSTCIRFIFDLTDFVYIDDIILEKMVGLYEVLLVITKCSWLFENFFDLKNKYLSNLNSGLPFPRRTKNPFMHRIEKSETLDNKNILQLQKKSSIFPIVVAVDAGHGGYDPGAKGCSGLYEKDITFAIATKLKNILDRDPMFHPVMIRDGDYFVSVLQRSDIARIYGARVLLSIHADAVSNNSKSNVRGASVWILSDRRMSSEMTHLLNKDVYSLKLFSSIIRDTLSISSNIDPDLSRVILDLQFCYSRKVGYAIALHILEELKNISVLHKNVPEYSSFAVLRAPDVPSILVETGFMTHAGEEKLLASDSYQKKVAYALYKGLRSYFISDIVNIKGKMAINNFIQCD